MAGGIMCLNCGAYDWKVTDTYPERKRVRRRKKCNQCGYRITTTERQDREKQDAGEDEEG